MKITFIIFCVMTVLCSLIACKVTTYELSINDKNIVLKQGMTMQEVLDILGSEYQEQPDKEKDCERWIYDKITTEKKNVRIRFKNKILQSVTVYEKTM